MLIEAGKYSIFKLTPRSEAGRSLGNARNVGPRLLYLDVRKQPKPRDHPGLKIVEVHFHAQAFGLNT